MAFTPISRAVPTPMPNDPLLLPTGGSSAFIGRPPNNVRDYYTIKGLLRMVGMNKANPMMGYPLAARPPPGYVHESRAVGVQTGLVVVMLAIMIPTSVRLFVRARTDQMRFGWDDWTIIAAAIIALTYPIAQTMGLYIGGAGLHTWEVTYDEYEIGIMIGVFCKMTFYQAVSLIKISIALFIRRLASGASRRWKWFCDVFLATVGAYMLLAFFWLLFTCYPIQAQWSLHTRGISEPSPQCLDTISQGRILSGLHVAQGMILLSAPIVILWTIQMNRAKKIRLFAFWAVGGITVLGGLLRQVRPLVHRDMTWDYVEVLAWTSLDLALGTVTASLPVLDGMLSNVWHWAMTSIGVSSNGTVSNNSAPRVQESDPNVSSRMPSGMHGSSESEENIVGKTADMEMSNVRARVVDIQPSPRSSLDRFDFGCHAETERSSAASPS
ncbi:uncharacterized protein EKO05_0010078 [Ascochyta rabiei]|uniref:uncharacterized protein n=1 Tax=Didymella rabiei TaxID=5454 RepID=UPI0021FB313C|nr:uncharacterized protein EKO05_0010078 [Ascochyta rabiei]UPX19827.1 hypothetical protein EKO05_0010078 [Ascochyta rabiei]